MVRWTRGGPERWKLTAALALACAAPALAACGRLGSIGDAPRVASSAAPGDGGALDADIQSGQDGSPVVLDGDAAPPPPDGGGVAGLRDGLVALYTFDGTPAQAVSSLSDVMGSGSDSSSITDTDVTLVHVAGHLDQAIYLDGVEDRIVIGTAGGAFSFGSGDFTLAAWVRLAGGCPSSWCNIFGGGTLSPGMAVEVNGAEEFNFYVDSDAEDHNTIYDPGTRRDLHDGQWHHVVGVKSGNDMTSYVDGQEVQRGVGVMWGNVDVPMLHIGDHYSSSEAPLYLDEVAVWKRALGAAEVAMLPSAGSLKP